MYTDQEVYLHSNLDDWRAFTWPKTFVCIPRVGDNIRAMPYNQTEYHILEGKEEPILVQPARIMTLRVCQVTHMFGGDVHVELTLKEGFTMDWWESMKPNHVTYRNFKDKA